MRVTRARLARGPEVGAAGAAVLGRRVGARARPILRATATRAAARQERRPCAVVAIYWKEPSAEIGQ